jgi:hypothetical protein
MKIISRVSVFYAGGGREVRSESRHGRVMSGLDARSEI